MTRDPRIDPRPGDSVQLGHIKRVVTSRVGDYVGFYNSLGDELEISLQTWRRFWGNAVIGPHAVVGRDDKMQDQNIDRLQASLATAEQRLARIAEIAGGVDLLGTAAAIGTKINAILKLATGADPDGQ